MPKSRWGAAGFLPPTAPLTFFFFFLVPTGAMSELTPKVLLTNHRAQGEAVMEGGLRVVTVTRLRGRTDIYVGQRECGAVIGSPGVKHTRFV